MGTIEATPIITPFWYRRISEITWLLTLLLAGLWLAGAFFIHTDIAAMHLLVPIASLIGAGGASGLMLIAYLRPTLSASNQMIKFGYGLMLLTALYTILATGDTNSPFIALWLLVSIFAAIFGLSVFIPAVLITNVYLGYLYYFGIVPPAQLLVFVVAFEIPLIASFVIWRRGVTSSSGGETEKDPTFRALAQELSQVANKSEIVINAIADGVVAVDGQGVVQLINPAAQQIIGWGRQDALHLDYRSVLQLFNRKNEDVSDALDPIQQCLHSNETVETDELLMATTSGKKLMVSLLVSPVGQIGAGAIVVFRDITNQRKEERQQAEFISTASHEMRTPVAAIEGYIGLALNPQTATIDDKAKLYLGKAHESAQHLGRLFQDLLDISKADDGRLDNEPRVIDLVAFVRDITLSFNHMAVTKGLILLYKPDTNNPANQRVTPAYFTKVDPDHVREVIANLIENAIKYTKSGDVTVDVTGDEDHAVIDVTDTGIGIPSEDIAHLFQKFYRVDSTDTREIGGTGLGLYLCRRLVETMGGRLWVTSEYGRGSTFHVQLPRMSNLDAIREIESSLNQPEISTLHATPSFLAGEEAAAAVREATGSNGAMPVLATPAPAAPPAIAPVVSSIVAAAPAPLIATAAPLSSPPTPAAQPAATTAPSIPAPASLPVSLVAPSPTVNVAPPRPVTLATPSAASTPSTPITAAPTAEQAAATPPLSPAPALPPVATSAPVSTPVAASAPAVAPTTTPLPSPSPAPSADASGVTH